MPRRNNTQSRTSAGPSRRDSRSRTITGGNGELVRISKRPEQSRQLVCAGIGRRILPASLNELRGVIDLVGGRPFLDAAIFLTKKHDPIVGTPFPKDPDKVLNRILREAELDYNESYQPLTCDLLALQERVVEGRYGGTLLVKLSDVRLDPPERGSVLAAASIAITGYYGGVNDYVEALKTFTPECLPTFGINICGIRSVNQSIESEALKPGAGLVPDTVTLGPLEILAQMSGLV